MSDTRVSRRNFCIVLLTGISFMAVVGAMVWVYAAFKGWSFRNDQTCFIVDMLESRVPEFDMPLHRDLGGHLEKVDPPLAFGKICFDKTQRVVSWKIRQSFSDLYTLRDFTLRGPEDRKSKSGPTVLALGVGLDKAVRLNGQVEMDWNLMQKILEKPKRYYLALEGDYAEIDSSSAGTVVREIARHNLIYER